jgi:hypothetical protein
MQRGSRQIEYQKQSISRGFAEEWIGVFRPECPRMVADSGWIQALLAMSA